MYFDNYKPHIAHLIPPACKKGGFLQAGGIKKIKKSRPKKIFEFDARACKKGGFLQAGGIKLKSDPCVTP